MVYIFKMFKTKARVIKIAICFIQETLITDLYLAND